MLNKLAELHKQCFPHKPWGAGDFAELKKSGCEIIASDNGFIVWRTVCDEAELITIGVAPNARRGGIAEAMLEIMVRELKKSNVKKIFLEVAADNTPARTLYEKNGFQAIGRRPKYYDGVDAVLMSRDL